MKSSRKGISFMFVMTLMLSLLMACGDAAVNGDEADGMNSDEPEVDESVNQEAGDSDDQDENDLSNTNLTWGSASLGSTSYVMVEAMASTVNNYVDFKSNSVSTGGSVENTLLIHEGELELGSSTADVLNKAYNGAEPFDEELSFSQLFSFVFWTTAIVAPSDSGIENFEDLKGKTVAIGSPGQVSSLLVEAYLEEYGMEDEVDVEYIAGQDAADALQAGQVDAATLPHLAGDMLNPAFRQLAETMEFKPVKVDESVLEKVMSDNEGVVIEDTLADTIDFYPEDVPANGAPGILITHPDMDEDIIYEITKNLFENEEEVRKIGPELKLFGIDYALDGIVDGYPVHPGAVKYYKEIGIWEE